MKNKLPVRVCKTISKLFVVHYLPFRDSVPLWRIFIVSSLFCKKKKKSKWTENGVNWTQVGCAAEDENLIAFLRNRERRKGYKTIFKHEMTFKNLSHYDASQLFVSLNRTRWTVESHRMENVRWVHALFTSIRHDRRNKSTSCSDRHL